MTSIKKRPQKFQNDLLRIMEEKHHWAWSEIVGPAISKSQLKIHYQQEYAVYVRDFPVFLARIHGKNPPLEVRRMLAENIFEEDTGQLSLGASHPALFLKMMRGLGFRASDFETIHLLAATRRYRKWLDQVSDSPDWVLAAAVMTIFVEGSVNDRKELAGSARKKSIQQIQRKLRTHPLVRYHGVSPESLDLIRAHQMVEAGHRHDAYDMVVHYTSSPSHQKKILEALQQTLTLWLQYRDGVALACGLKQK